MHPKANLGLNDALRNELLFSLSMKGITLEQVHEIKLLCVTLPGRVILVKF